MSPRKNITTSFSPKRIADLASHRASSQASRVFSRDRRNRIRSKSPSSQELTKVEREFLDRLKKTAERLKDPKEIERLANESTMKLRLEYPAQVMGSRYGTARGVLSQALPSNGQNAEDNVSQMLDELTHTAIGELGSPLSRDTMSLAYGIASGNIDMFGELPRGILGDTSEVLANAMISQYGTGSLPPRLAARISVVVPAPEVCAACSAAAEGAMEMVTSAMSCGCAKVQSLLSVVGQMNGAVDLLTASLNKVMDTCISKMMTKIMAMVQAAHGITHPLFLAIFKMTWSENRQWVPSSISAMVGKCGENIPKWMECCKELVEYFDFVQEVMGGAINEICKGCDKMFTQIVNCAGGLTLDIDLNACMDAVLPPLNVPLMSISKQMEDLMKKMQLLKEVIRQKGRQVLEKLKSLEGCELFIQPPEDFLLILEVLVEATFIYANLHTVMDKILEFFLNLLVEQFAAIAKSIISQIMSIWQDVISIVPPLDDLVRMCWAIPNTADCCVNCALNIALPEMWSIIQPYVMMPFQCVDMISTACDAASSLAYATPPP